MSRNILKERKVTLQELKKTYFRTQDCKETGRIHGISDRSVRKILAANGVALKRGRRKGFSPGAPYHTSCLAVWLRNHPGQLLPRSVSKISELTGCTKDEVKTYLYRRRQAVKWKAMKLPFRTSDKALYDMKGVKIPFSAWRKISTVQVEPYTFVLLITVELRTGYARQFLVPSVRELYRSLVDPSPVANQDLPEGLK